MELSIIVPVYNMAQGGKLEFCMESLLHQEISDYEIIAVNDASTDGSLTLLNQYAKKYPDKVKVINLEKNKKQGGARNEGIKFAAGKYLAFVDSDDWVAPSMYRKLLNKAKETGADVVSCYVYISHQQNYDKTDDIIEMISPHQTGLMTLEKQRSFVIKPGSIVCKIFDRNLIIENNIWFPEGVFYEDNSTSTLWMLYAKKVELVQEPLYYYYQHEDSTVHKKNDERMFDRLKTAEQLVEECKKRGFYEICREELEFRFSELFYANTLNQYQTSFDELDRMVLDDMRKTMKTYFPNYRRNKYWRGISFKGRLFTFLNDISPRLFIAFIYGKRRIRRI